MDKEFVRAGIKPVIQWRTRNLSAQVPVIPGCCERAQTSWMATDPVKLQGLISTGISHPKMPKRMPPAWTPIDPNAGYEGFWPSMQPRRTWTRSLSTCGWIHRCLIPGWGLQGSQDESEGEEDLCETFEDVWMSMTNGLHQEPRRSGPQGWATMKMDRVQCTWEPDDQPVRFQTR